MSYEDLQKAQKALYTILSDGGGQDLKALDFLPGEDPSVHIGLEGQSMKVTLTLDP